MVSNAELVSRVAVGLRAISKDNAISRRYILSIARTKAKFLMSQKLDELKLFKQEEIKTEIPCFRMKRVKARDCGIVEFKLCNQLMKSCQKLPEGIFGNNGAGIFRVTNIDESLSYRYVTANEYDRKKKRRYKNPRARYFTIKNGYLYAPDSRSELLDIVMIVIDKDDAAIVSECGGKPKISCKSSWESDFVCPNKLLDVVVRDTISEVANFYRTSIPDENPDMDEHQKSKTTI